jgi:hypothetical protein
MLFMQGAPRIWHRRTGRRAVARRAHVKPIGCRGSRIWPSGQPGLMAIAHRTDDDGMKARRTRREGFGCRGARTQWQPVASERAFDVTLRHRYTLRSAVLRATENPIGWSIYPAAAILQGLRRLGPRGGCRARSASSTRPAISCVTSP